MKDTIEFVGYWNFNSDIDIKYPGKLLKTDSNNLTLLGCTKIPDEPFVIHGITSTGIKITLFNSYIKRQSRSFPGIPTVELSATYCFIGGHLLTINTIFKSTSFKVSYLNEWVGITGIKIPSSNDKDFIFNYKAPEDITLYSGENFTIKIVFEWVTSLSSNNKVIFTQDTLILVESIDGFQLESFWNFLSYINSFFTLAYFSEPQVSEIKLESDGIKYDFTYLGQFDSIIKEKKHRRNFLFVYETIIDNIIPVFAKWVELYNIIDPVINSLQELFRNRTLLIENKFLEIMHAIETFHRRRRPNDKEPKDYHKAKIAQILENCPDEYKIWLKEKMSFSNEPSLQNRLESLFNEIDSSIKNKLFHNIDTLILKAKNSRNYYTHYDKSTQKKALKGSELHYLTEKLKIFLLILLLKEIDIPDDKVNLIFEEGSVYLFNHLVDTI